MVIKYVSNHTEEEINQRRGGGGEREGGGGGRGVQTIHVYNSLQPILRQSTDFSEALRRIACGLMERYKMAHQNPPTLLYIDRDCCSMSALSEYKVSK